MLFWTRKEQAQCAVSTASVLAFAYFLVAVCFDYAWLDILMRHGVPLLIMNYWLVMVTYLQHHEADTNVRCLFAKGGWEGRGKLPYRWRWGVSMRVCVLFVLV